MNSLSHLSDAELLISTKKVVGVEKRATQDILNHLEEVELRKAYLASGYSSLLDYCIRELKYSQSSAHRRVSTMRLIKTIPEAKEKLSNGSVNLSTLSQLQVFLRREEKAKDYSQEMKLDLLEKIEDKSQDQCEREFIKIAPETLVFKEKEKLLTEDFIQFTFTGPKELKTKLDQLRNLLAHKNPNPTMAELIEMLADIALKKPVSRDHKNSAAVSHDVTEKSKDSRHIPAPTRRSIWKRDQGVCQYKDKETNRTCGSSYALQIDHIHPYSLGGSHDETNLRLLCRNHNQWRTRELYKN